jgi:hypothetical protein
MKNMLTSLLTNINGFCFLLGLVYKSTDATPTNANDQTYLIRISICIPLVGLLLKKVCTRSCETARNALSRDVKETKSE